MTYDTRDLASIAGLTLVFVEAIKTICPHSWKQIERYQGFVPIAMGIAIVLIERVSEIDSLITALRVIGHGAMAGAAATGLFHTVVKPKKKAQ